MAEKIGILLLTDCPTRRRKWRETLQPLETTLWDLQPEPGQLGQIDLLLIDRQGAPGTESLLDLRQMGVGVVSFDRSIPADVYLVEDAHPREVQTACQLLAEVVGLRRQQSRHLSTCRNLRNLANTDHLTQIANRRGWDEAVPPGSSGILVLLDLDHFKRVNDQHGHDVGDQVLRQVACELRKNTRNNDLIARLGGDEFGLFLTDLPPDDALQVVDRIRRELTIGCSIPLVASAGFVVTPHGTDYDMAFCAADEALRAAKSQGRDQTVEGSL